MQTIAFGRSFGRIFREQRAHRGFIRDFLTFFSVTFPARKNPVKIRNSENDNNLLMISLCDARIVRLPSPPPNKNRNFDTKRIEVTVLTFLCENAVFAALLSTAASKENPARFVYLVGFLPLWGLCGPRVALVIVESV